MTKTQFTLEYWKDGDWLVGRLREVPGVFSQGETLAKLERNIRDAYALLRRDQSRHKRALTKPIQIAA